MYQKHNYLTLNRYMCGFEVTELVVLKNFRILRHHDVIITSYWCNVAQKERVSYRPSA